MPRLEFIGVAASISPKAARVLQKHLGTSISIPYGSIAKISCTFGAQQLAAMKSNHKKVLVFTLAASALAFWLRKPVVHWLTNKIQHKETVQSVCQKLQSKVTKQLALPLHASGFTDLPQQILIAAFKKEQVLEVYGNLQGKWTFIKSYPFMASSGTIGPKLREGDLQIPEGIYGVEYLNPNSAYYLSMKVSYPNEYDKAQAKKENRTNLGNDIFIHGKNVTIGCIPIGDEAIEELFYLVAKSDLAATKIIISPQDFRKDASFPVVEQIDWTADLYQNIALALNELK